MKRVSPIAAAASLCVILMLIVVIQGGSSSYISGTGWAYAAGETAGGDLLGTYPDPVVDGIRGRSVANNVPTAGQSYTWSAGGSAWVPTTVTAVGASGGDLAGTYPNPKVDGIQGRTIAANVPTDGQSYTWNDGGSNWLPTTVTAVGAANGDLAGTYPDPTVDGIRGRDVASNAPTDGQSYTWNDGGSVWTPTTVTAVGAAGGDLSGTFPDPTVDSIRGMSVTSTAPTDGQVYTWDSTSSTWLPGDNYEDEYAHKLSVQAHEIARNQSEDTIVLMHAKGAGIVRQIFIAITGDAKALVEDETIVKAYVNGQNTTSISAPLSQFFAYTFEAEPFQTQRLAVSRKNYFDGNGDAYYERGAYRYLDMPFDSEMKIVLEAGSSGTAFQVWSIIYYQRFTIVRDFGRDAYLKTSYFENLAIAPYTSVELLNVSGRGRLDSFVLSVESPDGAQVLEANMEIYRDGESFPSVYMTGTEDITGNAFYYGTTTTTTGPYQGAPMYDPGPPAKVTAYRFFDLDQLDFETSLRIVWYAGHKNQGPGPITNPIECRATTFYYLDTQPGIIEEGELSLIIEDTFESYGEGNDIGAPWVQRGAVTTWKQKSNRADYEDAGVADAWMYHGNSSSTDYIVEAEIKINNFGTGEAWMFARGSNNPIFDNRITFGFTGIGAESELPNYTPVMIFVASPTFRSSSLLLVRGSEVNTLRLEVLGELVIVSIKRNSVDTDFRELFHLTQSDLSRGFAGVSSVWGDLEVETFRVYQRVP